MFPSKKGKVFLVTLRLADFNIFLAETYHRGLHLGSRYETLTVVLESVTPKGVVCSGPILG